MFDTGGSIFTPGARSSGVPTPAPRRAQRAPRQPRVGMQQPSNGVRPPIAGTVTGGNPVLNTAPSFGGDPRMMINSAPDNSAPTGDPRMSMINSGGQLPQAMPGPMMDTGGMFGGGFSGGGMMPPPSNGGGLISKLTGGQNTGVMGPGLWSAYNQMVQGDQMPQRRGLTY